MKKFEEWMKKPWVGYTFATCSAVVLFMLLNNLASISAWVAGFFAFVRPVVSGGIIAYVFNPLCNLFEKKPFKIIKNQSRRWVLSVICAIIVIIVSIILLCIALIPQLVDSVHTLFSNMDTYLETLQKLLRSFADSSTSRLFGIDIAAIINFGESMLGRMSKYFAENMTMFVGKSATFGRGLIDALMALILAIYFLMDKHRIVNATSKLMALLMRKETFEKTTSFLTRCNNIIIRYISVDIIDGLIVGIVNFLFMAIMRMNYAALISVIVGVTNLAPTFGPIIGAAIGGFILVLINPWDALLFLIFTAVLQTVDGYLIKPKLFGESLGVSSLMIIISIILGGRILGVTGILLAIPFAAILDFTWRDFVIKRLEERHAKRYN